MNSKVSSTLPPLLLLISSDSLETIIFILCTGGSHFFSPVVCSDEANGTSRWVRLLPADGLVVGFPRNRNVQSRTRWIIRQPSTYADESKRMVNSLLLLLPLSLLSLDSSRF